MGWNLNWVDIAIILLIILLVLDGVRSGLVRKLAQIAGILAGFLLAVRYYSLSGNFFIENFGLSAGIADVLSFLIIFFGVFALFVAAGSLLALMMRFKPLRIIDRIGGAAVGFFLGAIVSGAILLVVTTFPLPVNFGVPVEDSRYGSDAMRLVEMVYSGAESTLPLELPRLAFNPEQFSLEFREGSSFVPEFRLINFAQLEGATCIACHGAVNFEGYLRTDKDVVTPRFTCPDCGRTSEGCQTYEGHHMLYDRCPAVLGRMGYRTDCGMWPNGNYVRVTGTCTFCGEKGT